MSDQAWTGHQRQPGQLPKPADGSMGHAGGENQAGVAIRLPALDQYLDELHGRKPLGTVTTHLAEKLYRGHEPKPLPATIQAYYTGPATINLDDNLPEPLPIHVPQEYATVKSRITSDRKKLPKLTASTDHTSLTQGIQVFDPSWPGSGLGYRSMSPDHGADGEDGEDGGGRDKVGPLMGPTSRGPSLIRSYGSNNTFSVGWGAGQSLTRGSMVGGSVLGGVSRASTNQMLTLVEKYVVDLAKVMEKVKAGQVMMDRIKIAMGHGRPVEGLLPAYDPVMPGGNRRAGRRPGALRGAVEENLVQVYTVVELPAGVGQQRLAGSGKGTSAGLMSEIMKQQGYARTDMRKILDQLPHFQGQDDSLVQGLANRMQLYCYPPASLLYAKGTVCNELLVLLSGYVMLCVDGAPPKRLSSGTVLGLQLMTQRVRMPCDIRTDPNFEAHVASISWQEYEAGMGAWAADKVLALTPGLQFSVEARIRSAISRSSHMYRQAGQPLYMQDDEADFLILLVKGQVLVTQDALHDVIQSEGQIVQQLQLTMGATTAVVPSELPRMPNQDKRRPSESGIIAAARRTSLISGFSRPNASDSGAARPGASPLPNAPAGASHVSGAGGQLHDENSTSTNRPGSPMGAASSVFTLATAHSHVAPPTQPRTAMSPEEKIAQRAHDVGRWMAGAHAESPEPPPEHGELHGLGHAHEQGGVSERSQEVGKQNPDAQNIGVQMELGPEGQEEETEQQQREKMAFAGEEPGQTAGPADAVGEMPTQEGGDAGGAPAAEADLTPQIVLRKEDVELVPGEEEDGLAAEHAAAKVEGIWRDQQSIAEDQDAGGAAQGQQLQAEAGKNVGTEEDHPDQVEQQEESAIYGAENNGEYLSKSIKHKQELAPVDTCLRQTSLKREASADVATPIAGLVRPQLTTSSLGGTSHGSHASNANADALTQNAQVTNGIGSSQSHELLDTTSVVDMSAVVSTASGFEFASAMGRDGQIGTPLVIGYVGENGDMGLTVADEDSNVGTRISIATPVVGVDGQAGPVPDPHLAPPSSNLLHHQHQHHHHHSHHGLPDAGASNVGNASRDVSPSVLGLSIATSDQYTYKTSPSPHSSQWRGEGSPGFTMSPSPAPIPSTSTSSVPTASLSSSVPKLPVAATARPEAPASGEIPYKPRVPHLKSSALKPKQEANKAKGEVAELPPLPVLKGMPLYNGLAMVIRTNKQQVVAVHNTTLFLGEEGLTHHMVKHKRKCTVLATEPVEYISIPCTALVNLLPSSMVENVQKRIMSHQAHAALQSSSGQQGIKRWPEAADLLREYLSTPPGSRPMWQVEALADGFSNIHALATIPWQARVRVFSDLTLKTLPPGSTAVPLAHTIITVTGGETRETTDPDALGADAVPEELYEALASNMTPRASMDMPDTAQQSDMSGMSGASGAVVGGGPSLAHFGLGLQTDSFTNPLNSGRMSDQTSARPTGNSGLQTPAALSETGSPRHTGLTADGGLPVQGPGQGLEGHADGNAGVTSANDLVETGLNEVPDPVGLEHSASGVLGFTIQARGLTHEVVRAASVPTLEMEGLGPKPSTPGTDRVGTLGGWDQPLQASGSGAASASGAAFSPPAAYAAYDLQPHQQIATLAAQQPLNTNDSSRPTTTDYAPSSGCSPYPDEPIPEPPTNPHTPKPPSIPGPVPLQPKSPVAVPAAIHAINLKTDDQLYIVIAGEAAVAAILQPTAPEAAASAVQCAQQAAARFAAVLDHPPWIDPLQPVILSVMPVGASFSAATALHLAELQPPGAPNPLDTQRQAAAELAQAGTSATRMPPIPGTRQIMAVQQGEANLEVLCMSRPLFSLSVMGGARTARLDEVSQCLRGSSWMSALWQCMNFEQRPLSPRQSGFIDGLEEVAYNLQPHCRVEEYKVGMELLRRAEPAPVLYFILEGEAMLNAAYVGLADANPAGAPLHQLSRLQRPGCCGELSLLASRPLWYSLMVSSPTIKVMCLELAALRDFVATHVTPEGAAELLRAVAAVDLDLYATAIQNQAKKLGTGELELGLFNPATRALLLQVMDLGQLDQSQTHAAVQTAAEEAAAVVVAPVVIEGGGGMADEIVENLARPTIIYPTVHEVAALRKTQKHVRNVASFLSDLDSGSTIKNLPSALPMAMGAGTALLSQSLSLYSTTSHLDLSRSQDPVLRVTMPSISTEENAYKRPVSVRPPKQFDMRPVPKALTGAEIEANRVPDDEVLPLSVLTAQQVLDAIRVRVHLKPAAVQGVPKLVDDVQQASARAYSASPIPGIRLLTASPASNPRRPRRSSMLAASGPEIPSTGVTPEPPPISSWPVHAAPAGRPTDGHKPIARPGLHVPASRAFRGMVYRTSASTFKHHGRGIVRQLTQEMWDDSRDALERLLQRQATSGVHSLGGDSSTRQSACGLPGLPSLLPAGCAVMLAALSEAAVAAGEGPQAPPPSAASLVAALGGALPTTPSNEAGQITTRASTAQTSTPADNDLHQPASQPQQTILEMPIGANLELPEAQAIGMLFDSRPPPAMPNASQPASVHDLDSTTTTAEASITNPYREELDIAVQDVSNASALGPGPWPHPGAPSGNQVSLRPDLKDSSPDLSRKSGTQQQDSNTSSKTMDISGADETVPAYILKAIEEDEIEQKRLAQLAASNRSPVGGHPHSDHHHAHPAAIGAIPGAVSKQLALLPGPNHLGMISQTSSAGLQTTHSVQHSQHARSHPHTAHGSMVGDRMLSRLATTATTAFDAGSDNASQTGDEALSGSLLSNPLDQERREVWVRDGVFDPSGITNPLVAGLMTQAMSNVLPSTAVGGVELRVRLPAPVGGIPEPQMRDMPQGTWHAPPPPATPSSKPGSAFSLSSPAKSTPGQAQRRGGMLGGRMAGVSGGTSPGSTARPTGGPGGLGTTGHVLGMSVAAAAGVLVPTGAAASPQTGMAGLDGVVPDAQVTATSARLNSMTPFSSSLILRNRMRMRAAQLGCGDAHTGQQFHSVCSAPGFGAEVDEEDQVADGACMSAVVMPSARPAPGGVVVEVDGHTLTHQDLAYVTLQMPPPIKTTPDVEFSLAARPPPPPVYTLPPAPQQGVHMKAMMTTVSLGEGLRGGETGGKYVPTFLRPKRESMQPMMQNKHIVAQPVSFVVPAFSSTMGFQSGLYDEDAEIMYFD